jgi:glycosyltransferase involved in cell wall biosynthesis
LTRLSIIIPCFNASQAIPAQLEALAGQQWSEPWEVIVADNGSTDQSLAIVERYRGLLPNLRVVDASGRRGAAHARNQGAKVAGGESVAFCDADDVVAPGWLAAIGEALSRYDFVASRFDTEKLNDPWVQASQANPQQDGVQKAWYPPYLAHAGASGLAVKRRLHEAVGGFDETLPVLEDTDYCFRVQLAGPQLHFVPEATVYVRYRNELGNMFRQARLWAEYNVLMYKKYRPSGIRMAHPWKRYMKAWKIFLLCHLKIHRRGGRAEWVWRLGWQLGRSQGSLKYRVHPI